MKEENNLHDIKLPSVFEDFLLYMKSVKGCSERTSEAYRNDLLRYTNYCNNHSIVPEKAQAYEVQSFIAELTAEKMAATSVNRFLSTIRGFYRWQVRLNRRADNPCTSLRNIKTPIKLPHVLWEDEMAEFASLPQTTGILWPERDKALIMAMYSGGLRISEVVSLTMANISADLDEAKITGKGNKQRFVFFSDQAIAAIQEYLPQREELLKTAELTAKKPHCS